MRFLLYLIMLSLVLVFGFISNGGAKSEAIQGTIADIDALLAISQDLDSETPICININKKNDLKSCFCACRDGYWSCTTTTCNLQNKECQETAE